MLENLSAFSIASVSVIKEIKTEPVITISFTADDTKVVNTTGKLV